MALIASSYKEVMILTDFDKKGEELAKKLLNYLAGYPCSVDIETWKELRKLVRKDIKGVEDLYGLYLRVVSVSDPPCWRESNEEKENRAPADFVRKTKKGQGR